MWEKYGILEEMKCYINHKFTTIAWGLVFIIILFCGCSNMIEKLRLLTGDNIDIYISYYDRPITEFELGLGKNTGFYFIFVDRETKELVNNYSMIKSIEWHLPASDDYINFSTNSNKLTLFLVGHQVSDKQNPYEISVTVNGKKSYPCFVSVANYYTAATEEELQGILNDVPNSSINEIHITGDTLLSSSNSLIQIAQQLPGDRSYKYTLDLSEATNIDLSTDNELVRPNSSIEKVILPEELTEIGQNAFWGFEALVEITIPPKVMKIGKNAFGSSGLTEIAIPASVMTIDELAFSLCQNLKKITFEPRTDTINIAAGVFRGSGLTEIVIPASVVSIGENAFSLCSKLKKIAFEPRDKELNIAAGAFASCTSLSEVIIDQEDITLIKGDGANNILSHVPQP